MKKRLLVYIHIFFVVLLIAVPAYVNSETKEKPIQILSDRLEAYDDKNLVVFSGNVIVTQEDTVMNSETLYIYYAKKKKEQADFAQDVRDNGSIDRIEAKGKVRITKQEKVIEGEEAIYYSKERKIIVTGNTVMKEGDNIIRGNKVTFFMNDNRGIVESSETKRVTATIYPEQ